MNICDGNYDYEISARKLKRNCFKEMRLKQNSQEPYTLADETGCQGCPGGPISFVFMQLSEKN